MNSRVIRDLILVSFLSFRVFSPAPHLYTCIQCCCIGEPMECELKMETLGSPDRDGGVEKDACVEGAEGMADCDVLKGGEDTEDSKKRKRKPYRPGWLLLCSERINFHRYPSSHKMFTHNLLLNGVRNWRLHGATEEMPHTAKERIFCPTCWRDYIRWPANRENN